MQINRTQSLGILEGLAQRSASLPSLKSEQGIVSNKLK